MQISKKHLTNYITRKSNNCWFWQRSKSKQGYGNYCSNGKVYRAHRVSAHLFLKMPLESKKLVLHKCDNPPCVNPEHLFIGTQKDNMIDASKKNKFNRVGTNNGHAKLNPKKIKEIRNRLKNGETQTSIGVTFNVPQSTIWKIKNKVLWGHV